MNCPHCGKEISETKQIVVYENLNVEGWKGKDSITIEVIDGGYRLTAHRKDKETLEIHTEQHIVLKEHIDVIWKIICDNYPLYDENRKATIMRYRVLVEHLINHYKINIAEQMSITDLLEAFNGGRYRSKFYFPLYYHPLKCLEKLGKIKYFGRGGVGRLKEHDA